MRRPRCSDAQAVRWQKTIRAKPDPFSPAERDQILAYFLEKKPFWHPLVYFLFYVGTRPSEAAGLRIADIDLKIGTFSGVFARAS
jgi:integrase